MKTFSRYLAILICLATVLNADEYQTEKERDEAFRKELQRLNEAYKDIPVETTKGNQTKILKLTGGVLKNMARGEKFIMTYTSSGKPVWAQRWHRSPPEETNLIPVIEGYRFGLYLTLDDFPQEENVMIEVVDILPAEIEVDGMKSKTLKQVYQLPKPFKNYHLVTHFNKDEPQIMNLRGEWKKEIYHNNKLIYSHSFQLIEPTEEEKKENAESQEILKSAGKVSEETLDEETKEKIKESKK